MGEAERLYLELDFWDDAVGAFEPAKVLRQLERAFPKVEIDPTDRHLAWLLRLLEIWSQGLKPAELRETMVRQAWGSYQTNGPTYRFVVPFGTGHRVSGRAARLCVGFHLPTGLPSVYREQLVAFLRSLRMGEPAWDDGSEDAEPIDAADGGAPVSLLVPETNHAPPRLSWVIRRQEGFGVALTQRGQHWYGETAGDIRAVLDFSARKHGGAVSDYAEAACGCGCRSFGVVVNERQASAALECEQCAEPQHTGPVVPTVDDVPATGTEICCCPCQGELFEACAAVVLSPGRSPRWLFLALRCTGCGLVAGYADWALPPRSRRPIWRAA
jgi:hypothetical protein